MERARARLGGETAVVEPVGSLELTVVAPVHDEEQNLVALHAQVRDALAGLRWELVLVDDGSRDRSAAAIRALEREDSRVRGIRFRANRGQTAATCAGIRAARAPLVATMDADLQNDPADLRAMLAALDGHDAVVGYRIQRHDSWLRRISSRIANGIRNRVTGDHVRDTGCALKLFRTEAIRSIPLFEGMHRFLPTLLRMHGYRVLEHPVSHHPRVAGRSKYGMRNRVWRAFLDLLAVRWMRWRLIRYELADERVRESRSA